MTRAQLLRLLLPVRVGGALRFSAILFLAAASSLVSACTGTSVHYVSNARLGASGTASLYDSGGEKSQHYGGIRLVSKSKDGTTGKRTEHLLLLRKEGSSYVAETMLMDNKRDPKAQFDKLFLSFGGDRHLNTFGLTLRFTY